jgi:hypothetical protein
VAYATSQDVLARAGRLRAAAGNSGSPNDGEIGRFLDDVSAQLDAAIGALGLTVPVTDPRASAALRGIVADGALVLWLDATFPSSSSDEAADRLRASAERRYNTALAALGDPATLRTTLPAIALLLQQLGSDESTATDFWTSEPNYEITSLADYLVPGARPLLPRIRKGMML